MKTDLPEEGRSEYRVQKIHAGHLDGSVILVGSVGNSLPLPPDSLSLLLPSPDENEESVQLLVRPERSAGSVLMVTVLFLGNGGETGEEEALTRLLTAGCGDSVSEDAGRLMDFVILSTNGWSSAVSDDSPDCGGLRPNSGLRMFSTEKGNTLETD